MPIAVLGTTLNFANYQQCSALLKNCPKQGAFYQPSCIQQVVSKNPICQQLNTLANQLNTTPDAISVNKINNIQVITVQFFADGQYKYYLLTPQNNLIDTAVDPRNLDSTLAKKYVKSNFMITSSGVPVPHVNKDGSQNFNVSLRITNGCLACPVIGIANTQFRFDTQGKLSVTRLVSFIPTSK